MDKLKRVFFFIFCVIVILGIFVSCSTHHGIGGNIITNEVIDNFENKLAGWSVLKHPTVDIRYSLDSSKVKEGKMAMKIDYSFKKKTPFIAFLIKDLGKTQDWSGYDSIDLWSYIPEKARDLNNLSVVAYEEDGSAYLAQFVRNLNETGWERSTVYFSQFVFSSEDPSKYRTEPLNQKRIRKVAIGIYQPSAFEDKSFSIYIDDMRLIRQGDEVKDISTSSEILNGTTTQDTSIPKSPSQLQVVRTNELGKLEPDDGSVYHGVWVFPGFKEGIGSERTVWERQIDGKAISEYENLSGRPAAIVSFGWHFAREFPTHICERINQQGKILHLGVIIDKKPSDVIQGKLDKKIAEWAKAAKEYGKPVFFRFYAEMNGNHNHYSEAFDPSQTHQMFIKAWRHVVSAFRKADANNLIFVWAPMGVDIGTIHWADYYPGDDYVDWVGISVYPILGNGDPEPQIMGIYNDYAARKPVMIAESAGGDADNDPTKYRPGNRYFDNPEKWINRYFDTLENKAPRVKAFVWFNIEMERVWKIQEAPDKIEIFKTRLSNKRYGAKLK